MLLYKPPPTPFWPYPAKQQGIFPSFHLRGKTNRQMLCTKGGQKRRQKLTKARQSTVTFSSWRILFPVVPSSNFNLSWSRTLERLFWGQQCALQGSHHMLLPEPQRYKDTDRYVELGGPSTLSNLDSMFVEKPHLYTNPFVLN